MTLHRVDPLTKRIAANINERTKFLQISVCCFVLLGLLLLLLLMLLLLACCSFDLCLCNNHHHHLLLLPLAAKHKIPWMVSFACSPAVPFRGSYQQMMMMMIMMTLLVHSGYSLKICLIGYLFLYNIFIKMVSPNNFDLYARLVR